MNRTLKISLACAGIFLAGAASGVFGLQRYYEMTRPVRRPNAEGFGPSQMHRFAETLALTEEQQVKIQPILNETADALRKLRRESYRASTELIATMESRMSEVLTPEQRERLAVMQAEQRERFRQRMGDGPRRPDGGGIDPRRGQPPPPPPSEQE